jgi:hypothetical protein
MSQHTEENAWKQSTVIMESPVFWLGSAVGIILTSKALMMGMLRDYPISLLLTQIVAIFAVQTISSNRQMDQQNTQLLRRCTTTEAVFCLAIIVVSCACLNCAYKILRFAGSLPTAILLLSLHWSPTDDLWQFTSMRKFIAVMSIRALIFACGFAMLLLWDFRLNMTSRDMSIAWLVLSHALGLMPTLASRLQRSSQLSQSSQTRLQPAWISYWLAFVILLLATVAYLDEGSQPFIGIPTKSSCLVLASNIFLTASAFSLSDPLSVLDKLDADKTCFKESRNPPSVQDGWSTLAFSSVVSLGSLLIPDQTVYLSPWQFAGYVAALVASLSSSCLLNWGAGRCNTKVTSPAALEQQYHQLEIGNQKNDVQGSVDPENPGRPAPIHRTSNAAIICAITAWLLFGSAILLKPTELVYPIDNTDAAFKPPADFDIVIAAYDRPGKDIAQDVNALLMPHTMQNRTARVFVYDKGSEPALLKQNLRKHLSNSTEMFFENVKNEGREGVTYLHQITSRWDELARHTLFIQEHAHDFVLLKQRILDYFVQETGFMSLSYEGKLWKQCEHLSAGSWSGVTSAVSRVSEMVRPASDCQDPMLTFRGQFLVSSARIRGNGRAMYSELQDKLLDLTSWMYAPELLTSPWTGSSEVSLIDPVFGYTLERLWGVIMRCSNDRIAFRSPSLLGSYVRSVWFGQKVPFEDVQCLDRATSQI